MLHTFLMYFDVENDWFRIKIPLMLGYKDILHWFRLFVCDEYVVLCCLPVLDVWIDFESNWNLKVFIISILLIPFWMENAIVIAPSITVQWELFVFFTFFWWNIHMLCFTCMNNDSNFENRNAKLHAQNVILSSLYCSQVEEVNGLWNKSVP